jgi:hypothetical protein
MPASLWVDRTGVGESRRVLKQRFKGWKAAVDNGCEMDPNGRCRG